MGSELKPCPFCGGESELIETMGSQAAAFSPYFRVTCTECGIHQDMWDERKSASTAWNTRADTENETLLTAVREMRSVIKQLNYWFDADEEFLAAMSPDELADHNRQVAKISNVLTKYAGIGE